MRDTTRVRVGLVTLLAIWGLAGCESAEQKKAATLRQQTAEAREKYTQARNAFTLPRSVADDQVAPEGNPVEIASQLATTADVLQGAIATAKTDDGAGLVQRDVVTAQLLLAEIQTFRAYLQIDRMETLTAEAEGVIGDISRDLMTLGEKNSLRQNDTVLLNAGQKEIQALRQVNTARLGSLQTASTALTEQVSSLKTKIAELQAKVNAQSKAANALRRESDSAKGQARLDKLEQALAIEIGVRTLQGEIVTLQRELMQANVLLSQNQQTQGPLREQIGILEKMQAMDSDQSTALKAAISDLDKDTDALVQSIGQSYARLGDLTPKISGAYDAAFNALQEAIKVAGVLSSKDKQATLAEGEALLTRASMQISIGVFQRDLEGILRQTSQTWTTLDPKPQRPSPQPIQTFLDVPARKDIVGLAKDQLKLAIDVLGRVGPVDAKVGGKPVESAAASATAMLERLENPSN